jgi:dGTPase
MARDFKSFDGNPQTLRIICRLQVLTDEHGLNLTYGTLSAARKYTAPSHATSKSSASRKKVVHPGFPG